MVNSAGSLYLDPQIRDWVLFPITLVMILVGILRHYVVLLLQSPPKKLTRAAVREQRALARSQILRATSACSPIPPVFYQSISKHLSDAFEAGVYLKDGPTKEGEAPSSPPNPITDPAAMDGMMAGMKTQMVMMVPQMVIMGWINFFFQGFVLIKLPFPLTLGFKSMLQRGIETPDMDVRWVSSLSWYFLNFFGLNGLYRILLGSDNAAQDASQTMMASPFATAGAGQPGPQDYNKLFKGEKDNLAFSSGLYAWVGDDVEDRALRKYGKL
ncbi:related to AIM27-member of a transmembrane complex required for efficient folding of proteins in the ER [Armillaria ostoyae]|uniref:ER membrane protein complex subunit 3 n=1 Tax=Armillaria ostoyae TaxID=47428 RepID=A0A284QZT1_ARMOS|nr:related to AIM27-member of a transmembrane complex required for efficient folding of proteins in the ER [Armillaria ostoyae]